MILLAIVFTHQIKIQKYMVVYIQQTKLHNHVFSYKDRYWKLHNEYHQHVQHVQQYRRTWPCPHAPIRRTNSVQTSTFLHPDHHARCGCWNQSHREKKSVSVNPYSSLYVHIQLKRQVRIHATVNVIRACMCIVLPVPGRYTTSTTNMYKTSRT